MPFSKNTWILHGFERFFDLLIFAYVTFPKTSKTLLSDVCGDIADERLFCFTSAVVLIHFCFKLCFTRWEHFLSAHKNNTYYETQLPLQISTKHTVRPQRRWHFVFHFFLLFSNCASSPHAVQNSNIKQKTSNSLMYITPLGNQWFWGVQRLFFYLDFLLSLRDRELRMRSWCRCVSSSSSSSWLQFLGVQRLV